MTWVADVVDSANEKLNDRNAAIGPSYFMKDALDETGRPPHLGAQRSSVC